MMTKQRWSPGCRPSGRLEEARPPGLWHFIRDPASGNISLLLIPSAPATWAPFLLLFSVETLRSLAVCGYQSGMAKP